MEKYEKRAVLFLDLLGFRDLIKNRKEKDIIAALTASSLAALQFTDTAAADIDFRVSTFSDCVVCSAKILGKGNFLPAVFVATYAGKIALEMLTKGILVRGAITVGDIYHNDHIVFGPALIEAYEMESKFAHYPRIILSPKVYGGINMSLMVFVGLEPWNERGPCRIDFDGICHLDILGPFFSRYRPKSLLLKKWNSFADLGPVTSRLIRRICKKKHKNPIVAMKYDWLDNYFKTSGKEFGW